MYATHLECSATGEQQPAGVLATVSRAGKPLLVRYDLARVRRALTPGALAARPQDLWRWRELLPLPEGAEPVSLGEPVTPLVEVRALSAATRTRVLVKDESRLATGSFKARGLAVAVSMARHFGVARIALPTNGNAGAALAAYCAAAGIAAECVAPADTPRANLDEIRLLGAGLTVLDAQIDECGKLVREWESTRGVFNMATLREPYRIEGKKTMGLELAEQLGYALPDAIFYPTGGGTGLIGMWKAFDELEALGFVDARRPRMYAVQAEGCAPIVHAFERGDAHATRIEDARTIAHGIRVPAALGDFLILRAVRESRGAALAVSDAAIVNAWQRAAADDGVLLSPEGAATVAGLHEARRRGLVRDGERVVLFNCAAAHKYPLPVPCEERRG